MLEVFGKIILCEVEVGVKVNVDKVIDFDVSLDVVCCCVIVLDVNSYFMCFVELLKDNLLYVVDLMML